MATSGDLIRVEHVIKEFNHGAVKALNDCSLTIQKGEVVAIIGPSGSGKSTLLRCLNLLEVPSSGHIYFNDVDITDKKVDIDLHRRKMGMVFQHFNLFPHMTVQKNITLAPVQLKLKTQEEADKQAMELLERIGEEGRRMSNLIDDILRLSSLESKQAEEVRERVDLRGLCEDIFRSLEPIMKKRGITGEIFGAAHYYAYPDDMRQLLKNLMENAVKYNRENGRVTVRISPDAYQCVISVVDTGIGIPLEHQSRVFERFYRVDKSRSKATGGTGLGLAIVKHIVAQHGASISLESQAGKGTEIRVEFSDALKQQMEERAENA